MQDAVGVAAIYAPVVTSTPISFELEPPGPAEMATRISQCLPAYPWLVAVVAGEVAGYAYADRFAARPAYRWSVATSVYVAEAFRRRGAGRSLYACLLEVLRCLGYRQALAGITLPNQASVALHEAAGFRPAGLYLHVGWKLGAWHDVGWWQCDLGPGPEPAAEPPAEPLPLDQLPASVLARALGTNLPPQTGA
jgi:L-amino acid N-acyltransferase YncA